MNDIDSTIKFLYENTLKVELKNEEEIRITAESLSNLCDVACEMLLDIDKYIMAATIFFVLSVLNEDLMNLFGQQLIVRINSEKNLNKQIRMRAGIEIISDYVRQMGLDQNE